MASDIEDKYGFDKSSQCCSDWRDCEVFKMFQEKEQQQENIKQFYLFDGKPPKTYQDLELCVSTTNEQLCTLQKDIHVIEESEAALARRVNLAECKFQQINKAVDFEIENNAYKEMVEFAKKIKRIIEGAE